MFFPDEGEPSISVRSDLEDVVKLWEERSGPKITAVLHVGFERVPARFFAEITKGFLGKMLVTSGAKSTLPKSFSSSVNAVGTVKDEAVFLATFGWGYDDRLEFEEPVSDTLGEGRNALANPVVPVKEAWIRSYLAAIPDDTDAVSGAGIVDEVTYNDLENTLPPSIRKTLGQFRFNHLVFGNSDDPCAVAKFSPPWLRERSFETLSVSVRVGNVLKDKGIVVVSDLENTSLSDLMSTKNFGRTSARDLLNALQRGLSEGPRSEDVRLEFEADLGFLNGINRSLLKLEDRKRDILEKRMGWQSASLTLAEIGEEYGITRERIRQIEAKTIAKLSAEEIWDDLLIRKVEILLKDRDTPLPLNGIEIVDEWFAGVSSRSSVLQFWLSATPGTPFHLIEIDELLYLSRLDQDSWESALRSAKSLLKSGVQMGWNDKTCRQNTDSLLVDGGRELRSILWDKASALCHFVETQEGRLLQSYGRGAEQVVLAVLQGSEVPLHYSDIAKMASERAGHEIEVRRAHTAAANAAVLLGRGIYGVRRHIPLTDGQFATLGDLAEEMVLSGPGDRQWHAIEILGVVADELGEEFTGVDQYIISASLEERQTVESLGRMVWKPVEGENVDSGSRIDIRQALVLLLEEAGMPLRTNDLRDRLNNYRGTSGALQIMPYEPMIRVSRGLWGLNDRDVPIKKSDQPHLCHFASSILRNLGRGIHVSEIDSHFFNLPPIDPEALFSILSLDDELQVSVGRYLYLGEWGGPRRKSLLEAVFEVLDVTKEPMKLKDIHLKANVLMKRDIDKSAVSATLQKLDAVQVGDGRWAMDQGAEDFQN
jgi:hypothetical protein